MFILILYEAAHVGLGEIHMRAAAEAVLVTGWTVFVVTTLSRCDYFGQSCSTAAELQLRRDVLARPGSAAALVLGQTYLK